MLWDVWEGLLDLFNLTIRPSLKNLFSSKKNFFGMFLAVFFLQTLLSVICIAGIANLQNQNDIVNNYLTYTDKVSDEEEISELDKNIEVVLNSSGILVGALAIWWISALTVYWKMTTSAAERNKFIWGMYITYGAAKKKIHLMLGTEMYLTLAAGIAAGWPSAIYICRAASGGSVRGSGSAFFLALVIAIISMMICISIETSILTSKTCEMLLDDEGSAGNFTSPRRSGHLTYGFTPWRYATAIMLRMRKYYVALAFTAAVPVIIWVCCQTASVSETAAIVEDIDEFKITSSSGIDGELLESDYYDELGSTEGVRSVCAVAAGEASVLGIHMLLSQEQTLYPDSCVRLPAQYADGEATIAVADDPAFLSTVGFEFDPIPEEGEVMLLIPLGNDTYNYDDLTDPDSTGYDYIKIAISKSDGKINIVKGDMTEYLNEELKNDGEYEYLKLRIVDATTCYSEYIGSNSFLNVQRPYFLLNKKDYERITGVTLPDYQSDDSMSDKTIGSTSPDYSTTFLYSTEVRTADIGSHIIFDAARIKDTTGRLLLDPVYATNQFTLACADSMTLNALGLDGITVESEKITVVMPEIQNSLFSLEVGQKVRLAYTAESTVYGNTTVQSALDPLYQLEKQIKQQIEYEIVTVGEIITAQVSQPYIFVNSELYSDLLGLESAYDEINLSIRPDLTPSEYSALTSELKSWASYTSTPDNKLTLSVSGKYVGILLRSAADYSVWLSVIAYMTPLLIPLVWYYPQNMIFARRKSDYETLMFIGRRKKDIRKIFAYESLLVGVLAVVAAIILCPLGMLIFDLVVEYFDLPLEFRISAFDTQSMLLGCLVSALCASLTVWLGYFNITSKNIKFRKKGTVK